MQHEHAVIKFRSVMKLSIELPDFDSPDGVTLKTLTAYVEKRGSQSVEEFVNLCLANTLGFRPPIEGSTERFPELSRIRNSLKQP